MTRPRSTVTKLLQISWPLLCACCRFFDNAQSSCPLSNRKIQASLHAAAGPPLQVETCQCIPDQCAPKSLSTALVACRSSKDRLLWWIPPFHPHALPTKPVVGNFFLCRAHLHHINPPSLPSPNICTHPRPLSRCLPPPNSRQVQTQHVGDSGCIKG